MRILSRAEGVTVPDIDLRKIEDEILSGLTHEQGALGDALLNLQYFRGEGACLVERRRDELPQDFADRPKRAVMLVRRAVEVLADCYGAPPTRKLENGEREDSWLRGVYKDTSINSKWAEADRLSTLSDFCAFQVEATGDPRRPIAVYLWGREEVVPFTSDDDPACAAAVVVISRFDAQTTYRLWTPDEVRTYRTKKLAVGSTSGGRVAEFVGSEPNPHGCIPFVFVNYEPRTRGFETPGVGSVLRETNAEVDRFLSDVEDWIRFYARPLGFATNVPPSWTANGRPGSFTPIPYAGDLGGSMPGPTVEYLQSDLDIPALWAHLKNSIDQAFTDVGVPLAVARGDAGGVTSGIGLLVEQAPLLTRTRRRRHLFGEYERELAGLILKIGGSYYGDAGLQAAGEDPQLSLGWSLQTVPIPDPTILAAEQADLEAGLVSEVQVLMQRNGWSREEAMAHLEQVQADKEFLEKLRGPAVATPPPVTPAPEPAAEAGAGESLGEDL